MTNPKAATTDTIINTPMTSTEIHVSQLAAQILAAAMIRYRGGDMPAFNLDSKEDVEAVSDFALACAVTLVTKTQAALAAIRQS